MPTQDYVLYRTINGSQVPWETRSRGWGHSPRIDGKLVLVSNPYSDVRSRMLYYGGDTWLGVPQGVPTITGYPEYSEALYKAEQQSFSRLRGKLYEGSAALGISFATYKQSREMIVSRCKTMATQADELADAAFRSKRAGRDSSGLVLEGIFGWQPLVADVYNATMRVIQDAPSGGFVTGFGRSDIRILDGFQVPGYSNLLSVTGSIRHKRTAMYTVSNPNKWLLERAGLLNPLAVAWDLVPWSFAVNMISNVGSLVNSVTDFAGLDFQTGSMTESVDYNAYSTITLTASGPDGDIVYRGMSGGVRNQKNRILGDSTEPPPWSLRFRMPDVNWTTAAIAASLATQKIGKLISKFPPNRRPYTE